MSDPYKGNRSFLGGKEAVRIIEDSGDANIKYVGKADPGTATSEQKWQIQKIDETSGTIITWADGNIAYDNIFDNRESISYS